VDWEHGKVTIFLISGKVEAGKSATAEALAKVMDEKDTPLLTQVMSFGFYVKDVAYSSFGWDGEKDAKGRRLLQVIGTEAGREYDYNMWVKQAYEDLLGMFPPNVVIFDDWRFENEYRYFLDKPEIGKVFKIRVFRDTEKTFDHISEKSLPQSEITPDFYDYRIDNNGTVEDLKDTVREMVEEFSL